MTHIKGNSMSRYLLTLIILVFGALLAYSPAGAEASRDEAYPPPVDESSEDQPEEADSTPESTPVCTPDIPNMVGYWPLDDPDPGNPTITFANYMGASNGTCTKPGCPTRLPAGKVNGAYTFVNYDPYDPVPDLPDKIDVPKYPALDWLVGDSFSFETWVKMPNTVNCSGRQVFVGRRGVVGSPVFSIWLGCEEGTNTAMFSARDSNATLFDVQGKKTLTDGTWHHLVGVRDATAKKLNLYVDGVLEGSKNADYKSSFSDGRDLSIGYFNTGFAPYYYYQGSLDEVAVYKRALTLQNVLLHYNNGVGKSYCSPGTSGPKVTNPGNQQNTEGDVISLQIEATDQENGTLAFSASGLPPFLSINTNGLIAGSIDCEASADSPYTVTLTAKNTTSNKSGSATFSWAVTDNPNCEQLPRILLPVVLQSYP